MSHKTITIRELEDLTWKVESVEHIGGDFSEHEVPAGIDADDEPIMETRYAHWQGGTCTLRCIEHPEITYGIEWQANGGTDTLEDAYDFELSVADQIPCSLDAPGYKILDIDGDEITESEAVYQVGDDIQRTADWQGAVRKILPAMPEAEDIEDIDEDDDMETITLRRDDGADIRFQGEQIASESSWHHDGPRNTRWTVLTLYRTRGGKLVCSEVGRTIWQGERDRFKVHVADTEQQLIDSLGFGWLAKELYEEAGIDHAQDIA